MDCTGKVGVMTSKMPTLSSAEATSHVLAKSVLSHGGAWRWEGGSVAFSADGQLVVRNGARAGGTWGAVPSPWRKDSLHVMSGGYAYLLMFLAEKWAFVALRCADEQVTFGLLDAHPLPEYRLIF